MDDKIITTNQNNKLALEKTKNLLEITNKVIENKRYGPKWQFYLPNDNSLCRVESRAINSKEPILISYDFVIYNAFLCLLKRIIINNLRCEKSLLICSCELLKYRIKETLENINIDIYLNNEIEKLNQINLHYDGIFVLNGLDLTIDNYKLLKEISPNISISIENDTSISKKNNIISLFPNIVQFEVKEVFFCAYEIYDFAIKFLPNSSILIDKKLKDKLKEYKAGANKPYLHLVESFKKELEIINDIIDENQTSNIAIVLPYKKDKINYDLSVDKYHKELFKTHNCSKYYDGININKLYNILITTFENIQYLKVDCLIIPQFKKSKEIVENEVIFKALSNVENELHLFQKNTERLD